MKIVFHEDAKIDLDDAVKWYESERSGLGDRFVGVIDETVLRIARLPGFNTMVAPGLYRAIVKRFPYAIYYEYSDDEIIIYAVAHMHRLPYWNRRRG